MRRSRFKSIFVKTMTAVSVICFLATTGLWVRSYWVGDFVQRDDGNNQFLVVSSIDGVIEIYSYPNERWPTFKDGVKRYYYHSTDDPRTLRQFRPSFSSRFDPNFWKVTFPHWIISSFFGVILVVFGFGAWLRQRRCDIGHCPTCNYDLRATPDRCPECGTAATADGSRSNRS